MYFQDCYPLKSKARGRAIIVNMAEFDNERQDRAGSGVDATNLRRLFEDLDFVVDQWVNFTRRVNRNICHLSRNILHAHGFLLTLLSFDWALYHILYTQYSGNLWTLWFHNSIILHSLMHESH